MHKRPYGLDQNSLAKQNSQQHLNVLPGESRQNEIIMRQNKEH